MPLVLIGILVAVRAVVRSDRWAPLVFILVVLPLDFAANGVSIMGAVKIVCLGVVLALAVWSFRNASRPSA